MSRWIPAILPRSGAHAWKGPEARAQHLSDAVVGVARRSERSAHREKSVDHALEAFVDHRDARLPESIGVGPALVEQRVEARGEDVRRRKARMIARAQGRGAPVAAIAVVAEVLVLVPAQQLDGER